MELAISSLPHVSTLTSQVNKNHVNICSYVQPHSCKLNKSQKHPKSVSFTSSIVFNALSSLRNKCVFSTSKTADRGNVTRFSTDQNSSINEDDSEEYLEAHVLDAIRMVPSRNNLYMTMANGKEVQVRHINPAVGRLLYEDSTPTIFLKIDQVPNLMLPICVGELAINLLMKGFRKEVGARPNCYELLKNLVNILKYEVRMVKITQRVIDTYYARIYLAKPGDDPSQVVSVDSRPSDAINLALRCKVPIFVSKSIILSDAIQIAYDADLDGGSSVCAEETITKPKDIPSGNDKLAEEVYLIKCMHQAVEEERYADAAKIRDQLSKLRDRMNGQINSF